jgi:hypothetical protein
VLALIGQMTEWLRAPSGGRVLRPFQAVALAELHYYRGLFAPARVGSGKTDVTFNAPVVLNAQRPLLVIPAKLRDKTFFEFEKLYQHWRGPQSLRVISYEELSRDYGAKKTIVEQDPKTGAWKEYTVEDPRNGILATADPDLIMADEVHRFRNPKAACTIKMRRFLEVRPHIIFIGLSGTITKRSVKDYAHILEWCLKQGVPLPRDYNARLQWARALDVKVNELDRVGVGALLEFAIKEDWLNPDGTVADERTAARRGYRRRLIETPGVVSYSKGYDESSLYIEAFEPFGDRESNHHTKPEIYWGYNAATEQAFRDLRNEWKLPSGEMVLPDKVSADTTPKPKESKDRMSGMARWSHARQFALGFYYVIDPPPPPPWKFARMEWHGAVREAIRAGFGRGIDSPAQVAQACLANPPIAGEFWEDIRRRYQEWLAVKESFDPDKSKKSVWIDEGPLQAIAQWMHKHCGIVWCEHIEFAQRLSKETGAPYYGAQGRSATGEQIEKATPKAYKHGIIASIKSNTEGRNLQEHWYENFIASCPTGGDEIEQLIGRTHREGQPEDEVNVTILLGCREQLEAWLQAREDAHYQTDTTRETHEPSKILIADQVMPGWDEIARRATISARYW